jgi:hypothetical protein
MIVYEGVLDSYVPSSHPEDFRQDLNIVSKYPRIHKYMCRMYLNGTFQSPAQRVMVEMVYENKSPGAAFVLLLGRVFSQVQPKSLKFDSFFLGINILFLLITFLI